MKVADQLKNSSTAIQKQKFTFLTTMAIIGAPKLHPKLIV